MQVLACIIDKKLRYNGYIHIKEGDTMAVESTQDKILNAFIKLLGEVGFKSTTFNRIAEEAGVNPSTIFRNFHDKNGLLDSVVKRHIQDIDRVFDNIQLQGELEQDLITISDSFQKFQLDHREIILVGLQATFELPQVKAASDKVPLVFKTYITNYLNQMKHQGVLQSDADVEAMSLHLLWLNFGYFLTIIRFTDKTLLISQARFFETQIKPLARAWAK